MDQALKVLPGSLEIDNNQAAKEVMDLLVEKFHNCEGYLAYKLTTLSRESEEQSPTFIIMAKQYGIILVDVVDEEIVSFSEEEGKVVWMCASGERLFSRSFLMDIFVDDVEARLKNSLELYDRKSRRVKIPISSYIVLPRNNLPRNELAGIVESEGVSNYLTRPDLDAHLTTIAFEEAEISQSELDKTISLIEGTSVFEDTFSVDFTEEKTLGGMVRKSLQKIFKQDDAQRQVSMQVPEGPQRIRGLAGTGKTIVLSLKAAITHKRKKNYNILYVFNTQSLYGQVTGLIKKYYAYEAKSYPDFEDKLKILHAWGGKGKEGLYSFLCKKYSIRSLTYSEVRGATHPLQFIYRDLIEKGGVKLEPIFDMVLIDEAQDLPPELFQVIYKITKKPKRIVWAYDEFQSLGDMKIKEPSELFGVDEYGKPFIDDDLLSGEYLGGIPKDFILPNCYRTPRPVLMMAHGIALGLYSRNGYMQLFDTASEWEAIGYRVKEPQKELFQEGDEIVLERPEVNSKNSMERSFLEQGLEPFDLILYERFDTFSEEVAWVVEKVKRITEDEGVKPEEIVIININNRAFSKSEALRIRKDLSDIGVASVTPGYVESTDIFGVKGCVTISTPFRAKGNEANFVFVMNSQMVSNDKTFRARNAFFASLTRTRGMCFISGHGDGMGELYNEFESVKRNFPCFSFSRPSNSKVSFVRKVLEKSDFELDEISSSYENLRSDPDFLIKLIKDDPELLEKIKRGFEDE
ncbi:DEAD/DEAH box helicase [Billgrantia saliphila]|uniref:DEAD/DEAH box helicase n=1 Tax=Billgrantia saliphila TaxID=1848458 RepID=UPI0012DD0ABB|nr:DEAD/DEAH box helicase [Halomonas saliphila]